MAPPVKMLALSLSFASLATFTFSAPPLPISTGCTDLASRQGVNISYTDVTKCFDSIPFNQEAAKTTLESVTTFFNDYYISRDAAMTPCLAKPLESDPVDIVAELKRIGRKKYSSDRKFHTDVHLAVESLHDGHAVYAPYCYMAYMFTQPLSLYAPVINGKQILKVYQDANNRNYQDCTVLKIDGKNALAQVRKRADLLSYSKDPNVRLNEALASMPYNKQAGKFVVFHGQFAMRVFLPDNPTMRYELKCESKKESVFVEDAWGILPQLPWEFTDTASYIKNVCLPPPASTPFPTAAVAASADTVFKRSLRPTCFNHQENTSIKRVNDGDYKAVEAPTPITSHATTPPSPIYPEVTKIATGNSTVFFQLKDRPTIGIIVLYQTMIDFAEIDFMYQSLETLHQRGVTHIVIDVIGGEGGYANVGSDFAQVFFPNKGPLDKVLRMNIRVTPAVQHLSAKVFNSTDGGWKDLGNMHSIHGGDYYDSSRFFDFDNNRTYTDNSMYLETVKQYRNGRQAVVTRPTTYKPATHPVHPNLAKYPWSNNPAYLRIVTDGRCLSACAHAIYILSNQYNVLTYGIGGTRGAALSKYQYAAGGAIHLGRFNSLFSFANLTSPIKDLPYQSVLAIALVEIVAPGSDGVPLEFDAAKYPTDFRMDYDPVVARSREALWTRVAGDAWK
ncbi:MAG: hypothetical protein J3R72DRAFT_500131 [Linnemannia gamsii]|nr:MAG: hypothetical protein J3R72DRAFT_500131 [Linnemannia gamsii]